MPFSRTTTGANGTQFHFNYPTGHLGSISDRPEGRVPVTGLLEFLHPGGARAERIFILSKLAVARPGGPRPHAMSRAELIQIANFFETYQNHCVEANGHHVAIYVALAAEQH